MATVSPMARIARKLAMLWLDVFHDQAFGDLQLQSGRRMRVDVDCPFKLGDEVGIAQLYRGHVHRDAPRRGDPRRANAHNLS